MSISLRVSDAQSQHPISPPVLLPVNVNKLEDGAASFLRGFGYLPIIQATLKASYDTCGRMSFIQSTENTMQGKFPTTAS